MTVAHTPVRRLLIPAAAAVVALGVAAGLVWLLSGFAVAHGSSASPDQQVQATVVKSAACAGPSPNDVVKIRLNGQDRQVKLNGCGDPVGQQLKVVVPSPLTANGMVDPAAVAPAGSGGSLHRLAFVLLLVSTVVGGGCGYWLYRNRGGLTPGQMLAARPAGATPSDVAPRRQAARSAAAAGAEPSPESAPEITGPNTGTNWFEDSGTDLGFNLRELPEDDRVDRAE